MNDIVFGNSESTLEPKEVYEQKIFAEDKPFSCSQCESHFTTKFSLLRHGITHSNANNELACSDNTFSTTYERMRQERRHIIEKPFVCSYCDKTFSTKNQRTIHERTHTGEKPFVCSYCDKTFTAKRLRKSHERTHTGEKPYSCSYCDKVFTDRSHLKRHERLHTGEKPYICSFCEKGFSEKFYLVRHERSHSSEKPFGCSYCDKAYKNRSNVTKHERKHIEEIRQGSRAGIRNLQKSELAILRKVFKQNCVPSSLEYLLEKKPFDSCVPTETLLSLDEQVSVKADPVLESSTVEIMSAETSEVFVTDIKPFGSIKLR